MSVAILTDSASDISAKEAARLGIGFLPIEVRFGEELFLDGETLLPQRFYEKLVKSETLPKTSQINEYTFEQKFDEMLKKSDEVVAITLSSKLSGTYANAVAAAGKFEGRVYVVDSLNASVGERLLCEYALELAKSGQSGAQIAAQLEIKKKNVRFYALLDTLTYLKKGGRVSSLAAFAGQMLFIKPVVGVVDGEVKLLGKAIGFGKGSNMLGGLIRSCKIDKDMPAGAIYSGNDTGKIEKFLRQNENLQKVKMPVHILGCTIGTHIGPGGIGAAFFAED